MCWNQGCQVNFWLEFLLQLLWMTWNLTWWRFLFHIQNWWDSGHLLIYLFFAPVRSSETRQICHFQSVSSERMGWLTYNLTFGNILTNSQTGLIGITISWNLLILVRLWLSETGQIWSFLIFSWEHMGGMAKIQHDDVSWPYLELIRFWSWSVDFHIFFYSWPLCDFMPIWLAYSG